MRGGIQAALMMGMVLAPSAVLAQYPPITDRAYTLDIHTSAVLGSSRIVGMGGTGIAIAEGSAFMEINPAAPAVRSATSLDQWDWDAHIDWLNPDVGSDFDNNGLEQTELGQTTLFLAGAQLQFWDMGLGVTGLTNTTRFTPEGGGSELATTVLHLKINAAKTFKDDFTVGVGVRVGSFSVARRDSVQRAPLFTMEAPAVEAGLLWRPADGNIRIGGTLVTAGLGETPTVENCDPTDCNGYILPEKVASPWQLGAGVAYWFGATPWNRKIDDYFRDEKRLIVAADVVMIGPTENGYGVEAFLDRQLQPAGRHATVSVRAGAEYDWFPGWFRVRGGSYWEPGRYADKGGRPHVTFGIEGRLFQFCFWDDIYRIRMTLTGDFADGYGNAALSLGFWH